MANKRRSARRWPRREAPVEGIPDWVEWGGELVFAVDFTSGGAPIGFRASEVPHEDHAEILGEPADEEDCPFCREGKLAGSWLEADGQGR